MRAPHWTASSVSACFSFSEPSHQKTRSGWQSCTISSTHVLTAAFVGLQIPKLMCRVSKGSECSESTVNMSGLSAERKSEPTKILNQTLQRCGMYLASGAEILREIAWEPRKAFK